MHLPEPIKDHGIVWHADPAASGLRWRAFLVGGDELLAYESGEWEVRLMATTPPGQTVASMKERDAADARRRAVIVFTSITGRTPTVR